MVVKLAFVSNDPSVNESNVFDFQSRYTVREAMMSQRRRGIVKFNDNETRRFFFFGFVCNGKGVL